MKKALLILAVSILVVSCATQKRCTRKFPPEVMVKDSTWVETKIEYRDTVIYTPSDTVTLTDTLQCDSLGRVNMATQTVSSNQATVTVAIKNNELIVEARCDSLELELKKWKEIRSENRFRQIKEIQVKREKYIPGFYSFTFWYFLITVGLGVLYFIFRRAVGWLV